jgi:hypothetical protein
MGCRWNNGQPFAQAGSQMVASLGQSCTGTSCTIAVTFQTTFSTTATSSTSQTLTNREGMELSVTAGFDFIEKPTVTAGFKAEFSQAIQQSTGMDIAQGNSTSITHTISTVKGNLGAISFTAVLNCSTGPWECGTGVGVSNPLTVCQPDMKLSYKDGWN